MSKQWPGKYKLDKEGTVEFVRLWDNGSFDVAVTIIICFPECIYNYNLKRHMVKKVWLNISVMFYSPCHAAQSRNGCLARGT